MNDLKELKENCDYHVKRLRSLAFIEVTEYTCDGTPYTVTEGEDTQMKRLYEAYRDLLKYVNAIEEKINNKGDK